MIYPMGKTLVFVGLFFCTLAYLVQGYTFIDANSQTFDEAAYIAAGYSYITRGDFRLDIEHPPLSKELSGLALWLRVRPPFDPKPELWESADEWTIGRDFLYRSPVPADDILRVSRLPNLILGAVLVGLVGWWTYRLWGAWSALLAGCLAAFDPNLIAHGGLATNDITIALFFFLTIYLFWEYQRRPSPRGLLAVGIAAGLSLATKFTGILVFVILGVLFLIPMLGKNRADGSDENVEEQQDFGTRLKQIFPTFFRIVLIALVVVVVLYCGYGFPAWAKGFKYQLARAEAGDPHFYFLGEITSRGSLAYFPVAFLIKTPVGTLLMILASLIPWPGASRLDLRTAAFLLVPAAIYSAAMVATRINLGLRYLLPIYPFLFVLAGRMGMVRFGSSLATVLGRAGCLAMVGLTAASSLAIAPHQLAYFNELIGGPAQGHRYLSDSNLDWGQDLKGLKAFMDRERIPVIYLSYFGTAAPAGWGIHYQFLPGWVENMQDPDLKECVPQNGRQILAISIVNLQGIYFDEKRDRFRWLESRTPLTTIGHSIYVYDLTNDAAAHARLAEIYEESGFQEMADLERARARGIDGK
jgi:hypothetical protein